jgi:DNA-binding GntR family transcriptional regulator
MDLSQYQSQTLLEIAYKSLKSDITKNILTQGQKIIVRELVERYGISETPIKQALNRLISEEMVESIPRKGMRVRVVQWEELDNLFEIRYMLETLFIKNIMKYVKENPQVLDAFLNILHEHESILQNLCEVNEYYQYYHLDGEFHQLYIRCSGNKRAAQIYSNLGVHRYMYYVFEKQETEQMATGMKEHKSIYAALKSGSEAELKKAVEIHIENAKVKIHMALKKSNVNFT